MIEQLAKKYQVSASNDAIPTLVRTIASKVGNKRYLNDLEKLLNKLGPLSNYDSQTIWYLIRDIMTM